MARKKIRKTKRGIQKQNVENRHRLMSDVKSQN